MKNQNNDTFSLAQGKYPWGFVKKQINSKFVEIGYLLVVDYLRKRKDKPFCAVCSAIRSVHQKPCP